MPGEGAPPVFDRTVEPSLEGEESLEEFIAPSSREECHVRPVDVYEALSDERSRAYMLHRTRKNRTSRKGASASADDEILFVYLLDFLCVLWADNVDHQPSKYVTELFH